MTTDEAIQRFEKQLTDARVILDSGFGTHEGECDTVYRHRKEMAEIALAALRRTSEDDKAREEGRLVVLPCKVGDDVCFVLDDSVEPGGIFVSEPHKITEIGKRGFWTSACPRERPDEMSDFTPWSDIGKTVFLTRREAEAALGGGEGAT